MIKVKAADIKWDQASVDKTLTSLSSTTKDKVWIKNNLKVTNPNKIELLVWKIVNKSSVLRRLLFSIDYKVSQANLKKIVPFILSPEKKVQYNAAIETFNRFAPKEYALAPLTEPVPAKPQKIKSEKPPESPPPDSNPYFNLVAKWDKERINSKDSGLKPIEVLENNRKCFKENIPAYLAFLETTPDENEIFITIGFGGVGDHTRLDQLWPGPLRQAVNSGQKVKNILVDTHAQTVSGFDLCRAATSLIPNFSGNDWIKLHERLDIPQFGCGLPDVTDETDENGPVDPYSCRWDNAQQIRDFQEKWCQYNLRALQAGKNVHIGWYVNTGPLAWIVNFYNQQKENFPDQLFLLVGSQRFGCIPKGKFDQAEIDTARFNYGEDLGALNNLYGSKYDFVDGGDFSLFLK